MTRRTSKWLLVLLSVLLVATLALTACTQKATVSFSGGDGATGTAPEAITAEVGSTIQLPANTFSKDNFDFDGWSDGSKTYQAGDDYVVEKDVTFTAQWKEKQAPAPTTYALTYALGDHAAEGAGVPEVAEHEAGAKITLAAAIAAAEGWEFAGWSDGTTIYQAGAEFTMPAQAVTLTAQWREKQAPATYPVTYELGDHAAEGAVAPEQAYYGASEKFTLAAAIEPAEGWEFAGWSDGTTIYQAGDEYTMHAQAVTFTAQWKVVEDPIPSNVFTGILDGDSVTITLGEEGKAILDYGNNDQRTRNYELEGTLLTLHMDFFGNIISYYLEIDSSNHTFIQLDDLFTVVYTANNGAELSFDGKGGATLDSHVGTYELLSDWGVKYLSLTIGGNTYDIDFEDGVGTAISVTITIDETEYVFGEVGGEQKDINIADVAGVWTNGNGDELVLSIVGSSMWSVGGMILNGEFMYVSQSESTSLVGNNVMLQDVVITLDENSNIVINITKYSGEVINTIEFTNKVALNNANLSNFVGNWKDAASDVTIEITSSGSVTVSNHDDTALYVMDKYAAVIWGDGGSDGYVLCKQGDQLVGFLNKYYKDQLSVTFDKAAVDEGCQWEKFIGTYKGTADNGDEYVVTVSEKDIQITINGVAAEVEIVSFDVYLDFTITINGKSFYLWDMSYDEPVSEIQLNEIEGLTQFNLLRDSGNGDEPIECEWESYIGKYKGDDYYSDDVYEVEVTATEVKMSINGVAATVVIVEFDQYDGFTLTVNGKEMYLGAYSSADPLESLFLSDESYDVMVIVNREKDDDQPKGITIDEVVGVWTSSNGDKVIISTVGEDGMFYVGSIIFANEYLLVSPYDGGLIGYNANYDEIFISAGSDAGSIVVNGVVYTNQTALQNISISDVVGTWKRHGLESTITIAENGSVTMSLASATSVSLVIVDKYVVITYVAAYYDYQFLLSKNGDQLVGYFTAPEKAPVEAQFDFVQQQHTCQSACETCGKCKNSTCNEDACKDKCQGHETAQISTFEGHATYSKTFFGSTINYIVTEISIVISEKASVAYFIYLVNGLSYEEEVILSESNKNWYEGEGTPAYYYSLTLSKGSAQAFNLAVLEDGRLMLCDNDDVALDDGVFTLKQSEPDVPTNSVFVGECTVNGTAYTAIFTRFELDTTTTATTIKITYNLNGTEKTEELALTVQTSFPASETPIYIYSFTIERSPGARTTWRIGVYADYLLLGTSSTVYSDGKFVLEGGESGECEWEEYIGSFKGTYEGVDYFAVISATGVQLSINGVEATITDLVYDYVDGFTFKANGTEFYLYDHSYDIPISEVFLMDEGYSIFATLTRTEDGDEPGDDGELVYIGHATFSKSFFGSTTSYVITEITMIVSESTTTAHFVYTVNGTQYEQDVTLSESQKSWYEGDGTPVYYYSLTLTSGGSQAFNLAVLEDGRLMLCDSDDVALDDGIFTLKQEEQPDPDEGFDGTYLNPNGMPDYADRMMDEDYSFIKAVLSGDTLLLYPENEVYYQEVSLTWTDNVGTGKLGMYTVTITVVGNTMTVEMKFLSTTFTADFTK